MNRNTLIIWTLSLSSVFFSSGSRAHDTTHIHPLITDKIADLIFSKDKNIKAYEDLYKQDP